LTLTSAPLDNKYSTIPFRPFSEAANKKLIHLIFMILKTYSPKCRAVIPILFVTLTSAPLDTKYSTISSGPYSEALNVTKLIHLLLIIYNIYSPKYKGVDP
jgi:hypothetical protein